MNGGLSYEPVRDVFAVLTSLSIRDIVLIRSLDIEFGQGLCVLTGETGAGKSILLDALSLALGGRGDGGLVRMGQEQGTVSAVFEIETGHPLTAWLAQNDLPVIESGDWCQIILRRTQNADGRTRAYINDNPVGVALLRKAGRQLVEIHGQHEERAMVDAGAHRDLLDAYGGLNKDVDGVSSAHAAWKSARTELNLMQARIEQAAREADYLRASVEELTALAPQEGEEEELATRRQAMMSAEKVATDITEAHDVLTGSASPVPTLVAAMRKLERKADAAPGLLESVIEAFGQALDALASAESELEAAMRLSEFDPAELETAEERLFALRAASRKHAVPVDQLAALSQKLSQDLSDLDAGAERLEALEAETAARRRDLEAAASQLSDKRAKAAADLAAGVTRELPALKLDQAKFDVACQSGGEIGPSGQDNVEFQVQTNPGTRAGPLMKVASGGELSRFLLALKVVLADRGSAPTLVFDEVDTGVGGAVADAIGARLEGMAAHVQVLSVTHAPQVAARAASHLLISKGGETSIETSVSAIRESERRDEIARMLAGAEVTDEAKAAAERLIASAAA